MTFDELIDLTGMTLDAKLEGYAEDVSKGEQNWPHFAWTCTLSLAGRTLTTPYKLGLAHCKRAEFHAHRGTVPMNATIARAIKPHGRLSVDDCAGRVRPTAPKLADLLYSLRSDCDCGDLSFEDFCSEFGYDTDSRKAHATWEACTQARGLMRKLLGKYYDAFMACEED